MRRGITPVVAIALLLGMTVAASGGAYTFISQAQQSAQEDATTSLSTQVAVRDLRCDDARVEAALKNTGDTSLSDSTLDAYLYRDGELVTTAEEDISSADVLAPNGLTTVSLPFVLDPGARYTVELRFPDSDLQIESTCQARLSSLVGYWDFEAKIPGQVTDAARDSDGTYENNELDASILNSPEWVAGRVGSHALSFDRTDGVNVPDAPELRVTGDLSLAVTIELDDAEYDPANDRWDLFYKDHEGEYRLSLYEGSLRLWRGNSTDYDEHVFSPPSAFWNGDRYSIVVTDDVSTSQQTLFLNGDQYDSGPRDAIPVEETTNNVEVVRGSSGTRGYAGVADDMRIYNRTLSADEAERLHGGGDIRDGLVAEWTFDEGNGTTAHDTSKWVTGTVGDYALEFDGNTSTPAAEYAAISGAVDDIAFQGDDTFSLAAWLRVNESMVDGSEDIRGSVVARGAYSNSFGIWVSGFTGDGSGVLRTQARDSTNVNGLTHSISAGEWVHAVMTFDAGEQALYVDGQLAAQRTDTVGTLSNTEVGARRFRIGGQHMTGGNGVFQFNGRIDDVRVFDTALTADQVSALYNATR